MQFNTLDYIKQKIDEINYYHINVYNRRPIEHRNSIFQSMEA